MEMLFYGSETRHARQFDCPCWKHVCGKCGYKGHFEQFCRKNPQLCEHQSKNVQEVQTDDTDQNTEKMQNNIDIINMIRSLGLHEQGETKKDKQLCQHLNLQELSIRCPLVECQNPVFQAPVIQTDTSIIWDKCQNIVALDFQVATEVTVSHEVNVITVHDVEMKCAHYSYVTIAEHSDRHSENFVLTSRSSGSEFLLAQHDVYLP